MKYQPLIHLGPAMVIAAVLTVLIIGGLVLLTGSVQR